VVLDGWPGARCSEDFCAIALTRRGRAWHVLLSRSRDRIEERALAAACERVDIVVADRWLPFSCRPRWLKVDGRMLAETGGLAIVLASRQVSAVAESQGEHGWWRGYAPR
jgi:competence protein ComEC